MLLKSWTQLKIKNYIWWSKVKFVFSLCQGRVLLVEQRNKDMCWLLLSFMWTNEQDWNPKLISVCLFCWLGDLQLQASIPKCPCPLSDTPACQHSKAHTPTLYAANLQPSGSPDCVCSKAQLASFQNAIEHIPCLCFLYRPIKIFPLMASLLQVGEREILSG